VLHAVPEQLAHQQHRDVLARVPRAEHPAHQRAATHARSARPATVTLSRTSVAITAPAIPPARLRPDTGLPGGHYGMHARLSGGRRAGNVPLRRPVRGRPWNRRRCAPTVLAARTPSAVAVPGGSSGPEDTADGGCADPVAELEQCALDPLVSPAVVLGGEPRDQRGDLGADWRPSCLVGVGPLPGNQAAVPAQDGAGVTSRCIRSLAGRIRISVARTARSAQSSRGRGWVRRSTATSCRSTSSSASLEADDRPSRTGQRRAGRRRGREGAQRHR
jgi:hypothetical protein